MTRHAASGPRPAAWSTRRRSRRLRSAVAALIAVTGVHLTAQALAPRGLVSELTQVLLMPGLAAALVAGTSRPRTRTVRVVLIALAFSWLGDTAPRLLGGDLAFAALMLFFLVAQLVYAAAFWPARRRSLLRRPPALVPYVAAVVAVVVLCWDGAGVFTGPLVVYGLAIAAMAVLASGLGAEGTLGGAVFLVSDALIALRSFGVLELPEHPVWVMLTYVAGQALLVHAAARYRPEAPAPGPAR